MKLAEGYVEKSVAMSFRTDSHNSVAYKMSIWRFSRATLGAAWTCRQACQLD
jgi:hypothetical protein